MMADDDPGPVRWDPTDYHRHASAQTAWGREVHGGVSLRGDEHVIDLGCGDGRLTAELAARVPRGWVTGIDSDGEMIAFALRHHRRANVTYLHADARGFALERSAEVIVSTAAIHWVHDQEAVLRRCRAHLELGGRLRFQMGGHGNCAGILAAAEAVATAPRWSPHLLPFSTPWRFPRPEDYQAWLPRCGFRAVRTELVARDMVHDGPSSLSSWVRTTWMPILSRVPESSRDELVQAIVARYLSGRPPDPDGRTHVDMVRLEVEAVAG